MVEFVKSNDPRKIIVFTTGGTIEKSYDEIEGSLANRDSLIKKKILKNLRLPYTKFSLKSILNMDSLCMTEEHRELIKESIRKRLVNQNPIVVLHGTDTMAQTANYCFENLPKITVPIIFTGAMRPLGFVDSDAPQNVTESFIAAQVLPPGVYIVFHGKVFSVPGVRKNLESRTFEYCPES